jgi:hypothetical protein
MLIQILKPRPSRPATSKAHAPMFTNADLATAEQQSARLAICATCDHNKSGRCDQCCGGIAVQTLVRLSASRCQARKWPLS